MKVRLGLTPQHFYAAAVEIPPAPPVPPPVTPPVAVTPPVETPAVPTPPVEAPPVAAPPVTQPPAPVVPETYALTLPEHTLLDDADLGILAIEAKALGLTNAQAQALTETRSASIAAMSEQFLADAKADPEIGGAKYDATVGLAKAGRDWLFPPGSAGATVARAFFDKTGLGNHKELVRALARIGKAIAEDTPLHGTSHHGVEIKSTKDVLFPSTAKSA